MDAAIVKFRVLRFLLSIITSGLIAWIIAENSQSNWLVPFLILWIGLPSVVWLNQLKNLPGHFIAAYLMNKDLINQTKHQLKKLPLKTAEEWNDFQSFYDNDQLISEHALSNPKAFAVSARYSLQTMRDCGNFIDFMNSALITSRAIEQTYWETADKEQLEFVKSEGYESWAEYMEENGTGEDVRESWKNEAKKERAKRKHKTI